MGEPYDPKLHFRRLGRTCPVSGVRGAAGGCRVPGVLPGLWVQT